MPAGPFFAQAAAAVRGAVMEMRRDIGNKRHDITIKEQEMRQRKDELTREKNRKIALAANSDTNQTQQAVLTREANEDVNQKLRVEKEFGEERAKILSEIAQIENDIRAVESQARDYESRQNQ